MALAKTKRSIYLFLIVNFAVFIFSSFAAEARVENCSTNLFSDGLATKNLTFPAGGGYNSDAKVSLPMSATIGATTVDISPKSVTGTPYIWVPLTDSLQLVQIKTSDGSFVSKFRRNNNTQDCTANCNTNAPTWTDRSPATACSANAFSYPSRITLIPGGDVWVADRIGSYVTRLGKKTGCTGDNCYECKGSYLVDSNTGDGVSSNPKGVTIDTDGKIWVGNNAYNEVWKFNADGTYAWPAPYYVNVGYPTYGMMADRKGNIWISTGSATGVVRINKNACDQSSCVATVVAGGTFSLAGSSYGLGVDNDGDVWVGNWVGNSIDQIDGATATGKSDCTAATSGFTGCCTGNAIDGKNNVWVDAYISNNIYILKGGACGSVYTKTGVCTIGALNPHGMAIDFDNNGWVICVGGEAIKYGFDGTTITELKRVNLRDGAGASGGSASYNYSDMTGFRSVPNSLSVGSTEYMPTTGTTYTGFGPTLQTALATCTCPDINGVEQCAIDPTELNSCLVPLSLFSITGGDYTAKNLSITCSITFPDITTGLVPCGRLADNPATGDIDESKACGLCALFYMLKNIINFVLELAVGIGVFILIIAGLLYALSTGNPRNIELAKSAMSSVIAGLAIVFIAWLAIAVILQAMGYANIGTWNQVNCTL